MFGSQASSLAQVPHPRASFNYNATAQGLGGTPTGYGNSGTVDLEDKRALMSSPLSLIVTATGQGVYLPKGHQIGVHGSPSPDAWVCEAGSRLGSASSLTQKL